MIDQNKSLSKSVVWLKFSFDSFIDSLWWVWEEQMVSTIKTTRLWRKEIYHWVYEIFSRNKTMPVLKSILHRCKFIFHSSPPSTAYMRQWIGSVLVQMAWRLFGAKPLQVSKFELGYCQLDPWDETSVKFETKCKTFHSWKSIGNIVCEMTAILSRGRWVKCIP